MKRVMLSLLFLTAQNSYTAECSTNSDKNIAQQMLGYIKRHLVESSAVIFVCAIIARPAYHLFMDKYINKKSSSCYGLQSIAGTSVQEKKDGRSKTRINLGSLSASVVTPKIKSFRAIKTRQSLQDFLMNFQPLIEIGIADKTTPIIADATLAETDKTQRLYVKISVGPLALSLSCDVADVFVIPCAMIMMHLIQENIGALVSNNFSLIGDIFEKKI